MKQDPVRKWIYPLCEISFTHASSAIINATPARRCAYVAAARRCLRGNHWWTAHEMARVILSIYRLEEEEA